MKRLRVENLENEEGRESEAKGEEIRVALIPD